MAHKPSLESVIAALRQFERERCGAVKRPQPTPAVMDLERLHFETAIEALDWLRRNGPVLKVLSAAGQLRPPVDGQGPTGVSRLQPESAPSRTFPPPDRFGPNSSNAR